MSASRGSDREATENPWWFDLLLPSLVWVAIGIVFALQIAMFETVPATTAVRLALLDWGPWVVLSPLVLWFSRRVQIGSATWRRALPAHLGACLAVTLALELVAFWAMRQRWVDFGPPPEAGRPPPGEPAGPPRDALNALARGAPAPPRGWPEGPPPPGERGPGRGPRLRLMHARFNVPIYWLLVAVAHAVAFNRRSAERERRALQAEARLAEARLAALQAQINPHFLFNTLNTIALYVHENPTAAEEMIEALSEMLRVALAAAHRREVPLWEELAFINRYLAIQRMRFADRLTVQSDIEEAALGATVPTLLLQPLVENAVIHGIAPERTPGTVFLRARVAGERLHLEVADTGHGLGAARSGELTSPLREGIGLGNTRARLQAVYGNDFHFTLGAAPEGGMCAHIDVPLRPVSP